MESKPEGAALFSTLPATQVLQLLNVNPETGLSAAEAHQLLVKYGRNELPEIPKTPWWQLFLEQFDDSLVKVLLFAAGASFAMAVLEGNVHDFVEPAVILLILILNAAVGVWQEGNAEAAIEALKEYAPDTAVVRRNGGEVSTVDAALLVPGDIVEIHTGKRIPADCRIIQMQSTTLRSDRAILNGESVEVQNFVEPLAAGTVERYPLNMLFSGTALVYGKAIAVVVATGSKTEIGSIERDVREQEETKTPLQVKLDEFGEWLTKVITAICIVVFALQLARHYYFHPPSERLAGRDVGVYLLYIQPVLICIKVAVALAVAAIPEGLPAVVTTCLALGTRRMAAHNALVRELPSVESLGRCTVICSDKTGTLTTNMMSVVRFFTAAPTGSLNVYTLDESRFNVVLRSCRHKGAIVDHPAVADCAVDMLTTVAALCNDGSLALNAKTKQVEKTGEATEAALLVMAEKLQSSDATDPQSFRKTRSAAWRRNATLEFTRERKSMGVHCTWVSSTPSEMSHALFVKGAPEAVIERCTSVLQSNGQVVPLTPATRTRLLAEVNAMGGDGSALRCIGHAYRASTPVESLNLSNPALFKQVESNLIFVGVAGMLDPPRPEVPPALKKCATAGIRVVVITGDNKGTAEAICRKIGLFAPDESCAGKSFTGDEFSRMSVEAQLDAVVNAKLFSRTDPSHKLRIVELLQSAGFICAMTGDGVNDAPALKKADIGIAMGSGTEVAKAASKMVLADDNFASIVKAVREGRAIFNNTKQFIRYLISSNIGEVACVFATGALGIPDALLPIQLLWVNLITDGLPATALGFNPADPDIMEHPPHRTDEPIINGWMFLRYMIIGLYVGLATVGGFMWWFLSHGFTFAEVAGYMSCAPDSLDLKCATLASPVEARAIALSILVVVEMFNALNALSENQSIVSVGPTKNPWLLLAIASSMTLHFLIMYIPKLAGIANVYPLGVDAATMQAAAASPWSPVIPTSFDDWRIILVFSIPVLFLDELLKLVARRLHF